MPLLGDWRRTAPGFALGLAVLTGCQGFPSPKSQPPFRAGESEPAEAALTAPSPEPAPPPLLPEPSGGSELSLPALPITEDTSAPATPLLDAARERLEDERRVVLGAGAEPFAPITPDPSPEVSALQPEPPPQPSTPAPVEPKQEPANSEPAPALPEPAASTEPSPNGSPRGTLADLARLVYGSVLEHVRSVPNSAEASPSTSPAPAPESDLPALAMADLKLCRRVLGFGRVEALEPSAHKAGQAVILYCEMSGVTYEELDAGQFRSRLAAEVEALPESGGEPVWHQALGTAEDTCARPRHDYYVSYRLSLPASLPPGSYQLRLIQQDLATDCTASRAVPLVIEP